MSQINNSSNSYNNFKIAIFADCLANSEEIFQLIDEVFPIDSCRHYQVMPLKLVDHDLTMGMLDPLNEESLKFVNSIARVFKYNLEIQLIDEQTFQITLASYPQNSPQSQQSGDHNQTMVDDDFNPNMASKINNSRRLSDSAPTVVSDLASAPKSGAQTPELSQDSNPNLFQETSSTPQSVPQSQPKKDLAATLFEIPPEFLQQTPQVRNLDDGSTASQGSKVRLTQDDDASAKVPSAERHERTRDFDDRPTIIGGDPAELLAQVETSNLEIAEAEAKISELLKEVDDLNLENASNRDFLPKLLPELSWKRLLEQAFKHQTEQINLTLYSDRAKIVAFQDRLPQSTVEQVPLQTVGSLADEIKKVAKLTNTSATSQKVVLERFYEQERILLRLEFVSSESEEKIKIQILRGQTLKAYEQQQMNRVSDRALQLAQQLEKTLRRIQVCFDSAELNNLKEIQAVQSRINHQLRLLDK